MSEKIKIKGKSVEVKNPIEYGMVLASFLIAGAKIWPWHKGYKVLGDEDTHHTYAWEDCGLLKRAGVLDGMEGDYKNPLGLIVDVRSNIKEDNCHLIEENKRLREAINTCITALDKGTFYARNYAITVAHNALKETNGEKR